MTKTPGSTDISSLVKSIRKARGLTQEQLAHELGVTFSTVNAWENGRHRPIPAFVGLLRQMAGGEHPGAQVSRTRRARGGGRSA